MVTQWLACGTKITPFLKAHWKGFISQHPGGGPETVVFLWSTLFTFSSLYFYSVFLLCLQCENVCSKLTHIWLHPVFQRKCSCFLIKIFSFSAEDEVVSNTEVILRTEDHQPGSYNGKLPHFFSTVLLNVWKTHKWQEDVTLRECILSWNKTQNYAKINKAIFIAESSG